MYGLKHVPFKADGADGAVAEKNKQQQQL